MNPLIETYRHGVLERDTRRHFLRASMSGMGALWLAERGIGAAAGDDPTGSGSGSGSAAAGGESKAVRPGRAKHVIYLHMAGAPSQLEMYNYRPELEKLNGQECPREYLEGKRFAFIRGTPRLLGPTYPFRKCGESGQWLSDRLPNLARVVDHICFIHTMQSDQFNHAPAQLLVHTGNQNLGYPSIGSWVTYGLGTENENMPGFVVLLSGGKTPDAGKSAWGSGFLPSVYQGVQCRSEGEPVLFLRNPEGMERTLRKKVVDAISDVNRGAYEEFRDPETLTRIAQYELAYRMQMAASDAMDLRQEPEWVHAMYGTKPGQESLANNCLLARRLVERGVRYVQLFDWGWDSHGASESEALNTEQGFRRKCRELDQPVTALLLDLEQRGLLSETLVVWGGEFGRTPMQENRGGAEMAFVGRDHHPHAFTIWMAGGGVKGGISYGETDPIGFSPAKDPVNVRDLHATMLALLGIEPKKLTYPYQGLDQKLIGVKPAKVIKDIMV
jgi:hypothetical protein